MADATQTASRWCTRPVSAVTSPPPPRRGTVPSSPRSNVAGPRFETRTSGGLLGHRSPGRYCSQSRSRRGVRKCLRTCSLPAPPEPLAEIGLAQDPQRALGALLGRGDEEAGLAVLHLERDAAHVAADERARPSRAPRTRSGRSPRGWTSGSRRRPATGTRSPRSRPTLFRLLRMWMSGSPSA